jgi:hypothetical protein
VAVEVLRPSLRAQLAELRGVAEGELPPALLDIRDFLAAAHATFTLATTRHGKIAVHRLRVAVPHA